MYKEGKPLLYCGHVATSHTKLHVSHTIVDTARTKPHCEAAWFFTSLVLRLLCSFCVCMCTHTYHVCNNYVTYIVAMRPYFSRLRQFRRLLCVAAMSSLPQLRLRDGYRKAEQHRRDDVRLTESGNARSEQLNTRSAYRVANQQSLACLSGSERWRPGWF